MLKAIASFLLSLFIVKPASSFPWSGAQKTVGADDAAKWSPAPTGRCVKGFDLLKREEFPVSVCGWIGGQVASPAYCSTSSSCVWNSDYSIVGCCAIASSHCAFYTSCVDLGSPAQSGDQDDVYTCRGTSLCYLNTYPGNYHQWGCGDKRWATNVATSYPGQAPDLSLQIVLTGATTATQPAETGTTTIAPTTTAPTTTVVTSIAPQTLAATSSTITQITPSTTSTSDIVSSNAPQIVSTVIIVSSANSTPENNSTSGTNVGALAGGIVGGIGGALLVSLLFGILLWRRRKAAAAKSEEEINENKFRDSKSQTMSQPSPLWSVVSELDSRERPVSELP